MKNLGSWVTISAWILLFLASSASADSLSEDKNKNPYYASIGGGFIFPEGDEEILGHQVYEARLGARLSDRWSLEGGFGGFPDVRAREHRRPGFLTLDGDTSGFRFIGDALYHLGEDNHQRQWDPYLALGGGIIHYNKELEDGHTDLFLATGAGAFVNLNENWFVKPDYRVAMVGHDTEVNHHALVSIGYRWGGQKPHRQESFSDNRSFTKNNSSSVVVKSSKYDGLQTVYFPYDSSSLSGRAKESLRQNARWIQDNPDEEVTIEGHCDERGTLEYNIGLGSRRARSVYDFLRSLGVSSERLKTVSYGEEYPVDPASTEAAWAKNRRVEFRLDGVGTPKR